jgi:hypothetical protein
LWGLFNRTDVIVLTVNAPFLSFGILCHTSE